ncbi:MAG TPA: sensor histidine kinase [Nocardioidaceae bacterium]|nr:sensor histidine kinase [Nocardioidaceae bacterium]
MTSTPPDPIARSHERAGRWGILFAGVWLFYLLSPLQAAWQRRDSLTGWVGIVTILVFAAVYLGAFVAVRRRRWGTRLQFRPLDNRWLSWTILGALLGLGVLACATIGQEGVATAVYIAVMGVMCLPTVAAWVFAVVVAFGAYAATVWLPGWHADGSIVFGTLVATLAVWGITQMVNRNLQLSAAREDNARLAVAEERNRFARDLHDIVGHSLTVITVKAELANRLFDVDADRARAELADLERLGRDALAEVRHAVAGYRELTLAGELVRAREALGAADIEAHLPNSVDEVPAALRELFAWTVREGVTNVIRHSGAASCTIRFEAGRVEIIDDGRGPGGDATVGRRDGHGLVGLRERAAKVGAVLVTRAMEPRGFVLEVTHNPSGRSQARVPKAAPSAVRGSS